MLNYLLEISALLANRVVADVVMKVDELLSVEVLVEPNKGGPTDKIVKVVDLATIVVAELFPKVERLKSLNSLPTMRQLMY